MKPHALTQPHLFADDSGPAPFLESDSRDGSLAAKEVQRHACERFLVRITSIRKRLLDPDNCAEKYHIDLLRYAGIITHDTADKIEITIRQRKTLKGEDERTQIEVFEIGGDLKA